MTIPYADEQIIVAGMVIINGNIFKSFFFCSVCSQNIMALYISAWESAQVKKAELIPVSTNCKITEKPLRKATDGNYWNALLLFFLTFSSLRLG